MKYKLALALSLFSLAFAFHPMQAKAVSPEDLGLKEGDLISSFVYDKDPDIFIINQDGFKRLFLNQEIFKFYGHLHYISVKLVKPEVKDQFITSNFYRDCEDNDPQVYGLETTGEDTGALHHVDVDGATAASQDKDFFKKVFCINNKEFKWYKRGNAYSSLKQLPSYRRETSTKVSPLSIDPSSLKLTIGASAQMKAIFTPPRPACLDSNPPCEVPEQAPYGVDAAFTSDNPSVAEVDSLQTPCPQASVPGDNCKTSYSYYVRGVSAGEAVITAVYTNGPEKYVATMSVVVSGIPSPSENQLSIVPDSAQLKVGEGVRVKAYYQKIYPSCNNKTEPCPLMPVETPVEVDASFVSDNPSVAIVDGLGAACGVDHAICGISPGTAIITATYTNERGTFTAQMKVSVISQGTQNLPPVISGIKGPTVLKVGEIGTWTIQASDPENGSLSYRVVWGDEGDVLPPPLPLSPAKESTVQTATFTHAYANAGLFTPTFTVTDDAGLSAKTSASVSVGDVTPTPVNHSPQINGIPAIPSSIQPGQEVSFSWSATDADNDSLAWSVSWGDGNGIGAACAVSAPSQSNPTSANGTKPVSSPYGWTFTQTYTWSNAGIYPVKAVVSDCKGGSDANAFTVNVGNTDRSIAVLLDSATPPSASVAPGQTNVAFAKIRLSAGNGDITSMNAIQVASDSSGADSKISNVKVYDGTTLVGSMVPYIVSNGQYYYGWATVARGSLTIPANTSKVLTITADISYSAIGPMRLGIAGFNFDSPGAVTTGLPVYGAAMTIGSPSASISVVSPNGGESWQIGSIQNISWKTAGIDSKYAIGIGLWDSAKANPIVVLCDSCPTGNDGGSYSWTIPTTLSSGQYTIRVFITAFNAVSPTMDFSDAPFSIVAANTPTISNISPTSGSAGTSVTINGSGFSSLNLPVGGDQYGDGIWLTNNSYSSELYTGSQVIKNDGVITVTIPANVCPGIESNSCSSNFSTAITSGNYSLYVKSGNGANVTTKVPFTIS